MQISVGIAAHNAEANIGPLLHALTSQSQERWRIAEILVHSDASSDRTVALARQHPDPRVRVIDNPRRGGFARAVKRLLAESAGDTIVLLNDDIRIEDPGFIEKCVRPVFCEGADLVGAHLRPLPPRTFVEKGFVSIFEVNERIRESLAGGNSLFTCDGAAMALSRRFAGAIEYPPDPAQMGNVDVFLFLACAAAGYRYFAARDAVVGFRSPSTLKDYLRRNLRNGGQEDRMKELFGEIAKLHFRKPRSLYWRAAVAEAARHPLAAGFVFLMSILLRSKARHEKAQASPIWEVVESSKRLD